MAAADDPESIVKPLQETGESLSSQAEAPHLEDLKIFLKLLLEDAELRYFPDLLFNTIGEE